MTIDPETLRAAAMQSKAWPFDEARKLLARSFHVLKEVQTPSRPQEKATASGALET